MTDARVPADAVVVPGPSRATESRTVVLLDAARNAIITIQGAADALRSLGR